MRRQISAHGYLDAENAIKGARKAYGADPSAENFAKRSEMELNPDNVRKHFLVLRQQLTEGKALITAEATPLLCPIYERTIAAVKKEAQKVAARSLPKATACRPCPEL